MCVQHAVKGNRRKVHRKRAAAAQMRAISHLFLVRRVYLPVDWVSTSIKNIDPDHYTQTLSSW